MRNMVNPGAFADATGARKPIHATAEGNLIIARKRRIRKVGTPCPIMSGAGDSFSITVSGRVRWALDRLRAAGATECTPTTDPARRWATYVHSLREIGVVVETRTGPQGGAFAGYHARYVLRCQAAPDWKGGTA